MGFVSVFIEEAFCPEMPRPRQWSIERAIWETSV